MQIIINVREDFLYEIKHKHPNMRTKLEQSVLDGTILPKGHGRLGDLDELEQRISNFVEHDAKITDEYTVVRQRFIVDGIRQTPTIIEADVNKSQESEKINCKSIKCENCINHNYCDFEPQKSEE